MVSASEKGELRMSLLPPPSPAGWYRDKNDPSLERFWSGSAWTSQTRPVGAHAPQPPGTAAPQRKRIGCFGVVLIIIGIVAVLAIGGQLLQAAFKPSGGGSSGGSSSGSSTDPIEQARVVLLNNYDENFRYEDVKTATDAALSTLELPLTDEYRSRAWSSALAVVEPADLRHVSPMAVMLCVSQQGVGAVGAGMTFPDVVAICATLLR